MLVILGTRCATAVGVGERNFIGKEEVVRRYAQPLVYVVGELGKRVEVAGLAEMAAVRIEQHIEVAATDRADPLARTVCEPAGAQHGGIEQAEANLVVTVLGRAQGDDIDDAAHAIAERGRETAGIDIDRAYEAWVDRAEDALEVLQMIGIV